jgi:hypothetical protein
MIRVRGLCLRYGERGALRAVNDLPESVPL